MDFVVAGTVDFAEAVLPRRDEMNSRCSRYGRGESVSNGVSERERKHGGGGLQESAALHGFLCGWDSKGPRTGRVIAWRVARSMHSQAAFVNEADATF